MGEADRTLTGTVVIKNAADFIGECLGESKTKTKKILEAAVGKILMIDEAYMLDAGDVGKDQDKLKTNVIDTIVSIIQGVAGEDRSIIVVGYEDKMHDMFRHANPGFARRFPTERPFRFAGYGLDQLEAILRLKMASQELTASDEAVAAARGIFGRALMRPNFTNVGAIDTALSTAKMNYEERQLRMAPGQQACDGQLEAVDFDPDFDRGSRLGHDGCSQLHGLVNGTVVDKLVGYQKRCAMARKHDLNVRDHVPTNFVFKGFSGLLQLPVAKTVVHCLLS